MSDWASLFGDFDGRLWLNTADQGPMPLKAAMAAIKALEWKVFPGRLFSEEYQGVPRRLKQVLHSLIGAQDGQIILGNSATYGLSTIARALEWGSGDQVLLVEGDFPANSTPWRLPGNPAEMEFIPSGLWAKDPCGALRASLRKSTRVFCASWVDSFTGRVVDLRRLGNTCRDNGTFFVVNVSQGLGNRALNVAELPLDALTCSGSKWLCGPYGTGFCWVGGEMSSSMRPVQYYWQSDRGESALMDRAHPDAGPGSPSYDVFATANFLNYVPWTSAIECLLEAGIPAISDHIETWVRDFREGLNRAKYQVVVPESGGEISPLIFVSHKDPDKNGLVHHNLRQMGIDAAFRRGKIRISPHLFNRLDAVAALHESFVSAAGL